MMRATMIGVAAFLCLTGAAQAREPGFPMQDVPAGQRPFQDDNHAVRFILKYLLKVEPHQSFDGLDPRTSVLIVLGDTISLDEGTNRLRFRQFVEGGGSVLVATDRDSAEMVHQALGVRVIGGEAVETSDPADAYRGRVDCPIVREFNASYSIFQNIEKIATNRAGRLEPTPQSRAINVAPFPASCRREKAKAIPTFAMLSEKENVNHFNVPLPGQRILVLSDHSVFINGMILQKDNDNFGFALNAIRWVCEAEDGPARRNKVLLMHDGTIQPDFDVKVKASPSNLPSDLPQDLPGHPVDLINGLLAKWEDENVHNEILLGGSNTKTNQVLSGLAIALSVVLIVYALYRVQMAHHRAETGS